MITQDIVHKKFLTVKIFTKGRPLGFHVSHDGKSIKQDFKNSALTPVAMSVHDTLALEI